MDEKTILTYLKSVPLFSALRADDEADQIELHHLVKITRAVEYATGDKLFLQGDPADKLYIVVSGKLRLTRYDREGIARFLRDVGPGESFGETGLLIGDFHDATAEALTTTKVLYIEQKEFAELLQKRPRLRHRLKMSPDVAQRKEAPTFKWLRPDELIVYATKRHWAYLARQIFFPSVLLTALIGASAALFADNIVVLAVPVTLLSVALALAIIWLIQNWSNDHFVLTTQRIVHYEEEWPINRHLEEAPLDNIQDVHLVRMGVSARIFDYGDLILQTAGETVKIDLAGIPAPDKMREKIFQQIERNRAQSVLQTRVRITETLQKRINLEAPEGTPVQANGGASAAPAARSGRLLSGLLDYFFPPSWSVSQDGGTIIWRRYWLAGFIRYSIVALITVAAFAEGIAVMLSGKATPWEIFIWIALMLGIGGFLFWKLEDWRNDYFEITPTRFIQVERKPFLLRESRRETTLDRIQNISYNMPGLLARLFRYGTVMLETAGTEGKFKLDYVRHPDRVQAEISRRQKDFRRRQAAAQAQQRQDELLSWIAAYDALRKQQEGAAFEEAMRQAMREAEDADKAST